MKKIATGMALIASLSGCASIVSGSSQEIALSASPQVPVKCEAHNSRGSYDSNGEPGKILVKRSQSRLNIACEGNGYKGTHSEQAGVEGWFFGNILIGGLVGLIVDPSTGAMFSYDNEITVPVSKADVATPVVPAPDVVPPAAEPSMMTPPAGDTVLMPAAPDRVQAPQAAPVTASSDASYQDLVASGAIVDYRQVEDKSIVMPDQ